MPKQYAVPVTQGDLPVMVRSFRRALAAENKSRQTIRIYDDALAQFGTFLVQMGMPTDVGRMTREHVEEFIRDQVERLRPNTALSRFRSLRAFFRWLIAEGELKTSPMANMKAPKVPEEPPAVLADDALRRLLKSCEGKRYQERRDNALLRLLLDTGMRLSECANLRLVDVDLDQNIAYVTGKGRRPRACPFGRRTALALDRYLRVRASHTRSYEEAFWLGHKGPMRQFGIYKVVQRRTEAAGIGHVNPQSFWTQ